MVNAYVTEELEKFIELGSWRDLSYVWKYVYD